MEFERFLNLGRELKLEGDELMTFITNPRKENEARRLETAEEKEAWGIEIAEQKEREVFEHKEKERIDNLEREERKSRREH